MQTFDIIFAGGGATACVTAGRLAAAQPLLKILVIEAGPHTRDLQEHVQPARYKSNLFPGSKVFSFHASQPSELVGGRTIVVPNGKCVGGGSSVNFTMYTRASASDYDDWETKYKNQGWGSKDMIPLLNKAENFQVTDGDRNIHGYSGPIKISYGGYFTNTAEDFLATATAFDKTRSLTDDVNAFHHCNAYGKWPKYIDNDSGRRSDAAHHYLYNQRHNKNLKIFANSRVVRIIFEGQCATGVEYLDQSSAHSESLAVYASKMVVLSAGAFGSPAILQRSGIGPRQILQKYDVPEVVDLPGVGENYQDHNSVVAPCFVSDEAETLDGIFRNDPDTVESATRQWHLNGKGPMASNGFDAGIKLRPNASDLKEIGPAFAKHWEKYFSTAPDKPVLWLGIGSAHFKPYPVPLSRKYLSIGYHTEYAMSRGQVNITSGTDPYSPLFFNSGFLTDASDLAILRWGYKFIREIVRRMASYRGEYHQGHPAFSSNSEAACKEAPGPVEMSAPPIKYTAEDDKVIDEWTRRNVETTWHSLGTCAMKPREQGGVVDSRLNVYGVERLKVADMSICPSNVGANTYNTALGIGEKAAVIIAEELGITL